MPMPYYVILRDPLAEDLEEQRQLDGLGDVVVLAVVPHVQVERNV